MAEKAGVEQLEHIPAEPARTKRQKLFSHLKRFWWAYVLGLCCIVVLVVCLVIFVGIPNIAQSKLNGAKFQVDSIVLGNTRAETLRIGLNATIGISGAAGLKATIDPFTASMYLEDVQPHTPVIYLDIPKLAAKSHVNLNLTQDVNIADMAAFTTFSVWLLGKESIHVTISGATAFHLNGISKHFGVTFKKTLTLAGANGFAGMKVLSTAISAEADDKGDNFHGSVILPNPSVVTAELGNVTFASFVGGVETGPSYLDSFTMVPGNNNANLRAKLNETAFLSVVSQKPICETGVAPFELQVQSVINGGDELPYFANALGASNLSLSLDIRDLLKANLNQTLSCM